jgi:hypothetical protein
LFQRHVEPASINARQFPFAAGSRGLGIPGEEKFDSSPGHFGERKFALLGERFNPLVKFIRKLDLGARHGVEITSG